MSKLSIQIRLYAARHFYELGVSPGNAIEEIFFSSENRAEVYELFETLKNQTNPFVSKIKKSVDYQPFLEARLINENQKVVVEWTPILERFIDITYRCKVQVGNKVGWSKKIYHVPPVLINHKSFDQPINSNSTKAKACSILRSFLPADSFLLDRVTACYDRAFIDQ